MLGESRLVYGRRKVSALRKVRAQLLFVTAFVLTVNLSAMAETIPLPRERPELIPGDRQLKAGTDAEPSPCQLRLADLAAFKRSPSITGPGECTARDVVTVDAVLLDRATVLAVGEMSRANPLWGAPHIHGELLKLGFEVAQSTVARYMCRSKLPPSQGWRTFLHNHADGIAAVDLFVLPTIAFRILYCLVIIRHGRRIWLSFGVTENPTAEWISRQIIEAFPWDHTPRYLIRDRDTSYGPVFVQRLCAMGIRDRPIAFRSPWQNAYVERLIGSIHRECLDHMIVFGQAHLRRILGAYAAYYNESRTHRSLNKDAPFHRAIERLGAITSHPILGGLHHHYCRI